MKYSLAQNKNLSRGLNVTKRIKFEAANKEGAEVSTLPYKEALVLIKKNASIIKRALRTLNFLGVLSSSTYEKDFVVVEDNVEEGLEALTSPRKFMFRAEGITSVDLRKATQFADSAFLIEPISYLKGNKLKGIQVSFFLKKGETKTKKKDKSSDEE